MHTEMWHHPATRANVATLRSRGVVVLDPGVGRLAGADEGQGRLPAPPDIVEVAALLLESPDAVTSARAQDLTGLRVAVSAGGTREPVDPYWAPPADAWGRDQGRGPPGPEPSGHPWAGLSAGSIAVRRVATDCRSHARGRSRPSMWRHPADFTP
jgi:hypothetical protein